MEHDVMADNYGHPTMYQFQSLVSGTRNPDKQNTFNIHPDRVIVIAEDAESTNIYGISSLEAVYNSLMDLRKIIGAGGEGFYKNAAQSIVFDVKDTASIKDRAGMLDQFNESFDDFTRNRSRKSIWTPGMEAKTLDSDLIAPKEFFMNALNDVAAGSKIPATVLIGQQTGRLASDQDSKAMLTNVQSRRENFQQGMVCQVIDWLMEKGIIAAADYEVIWEDALAMSDSEKLASAMTMSEINTKQFNSGGEVPFDAEEIRAQAGFEPRTQPVDVADETIEGEDEEELDGFGGEDEDEEEDEGE